MTWHTIEEMKWPITNSNLYIDPDEVVDFIHGVMHSGIVLNLRRMRKLTGLFCTHNSLCYEVFENSAQNQEVETKSKWQNKLNWMRNSKVAEIIWNQQRFFTLNEVSLYSSISILKSNVLNTFLKKCLLPRRWQLKKKILGGVNPHCVFLLSLPHKY